MTTKKSLGLVLVLFCFFIFSGCGTSTNKAGDENASPEENMISEELHQAHCDLLSRANEALAEINDQVRTLNDKIRNSKEPLTDAQNKALDDLVAKQSSINKRMHEIKDVKQESWEDFKASFEKDLEELKSSLKEIIDDLS